MQPPDRVLGTVLPTLGTALIAGHAYDTFLARRPGRRELRTDVTALPYGPSVPHMFTVVLVIMLPIHRDGPVDLVVIGAHLGGQPLNGELRAWGATLVGPVGTVPVYRLWALDSSPPEPGLLRVRARAPRCEGSTGGCRRRGSARWSPGCRRR